MTPRDDSEYEDRKAPSKRKWQHRPEREDEPRTRRRPKPRRPDDVVWDWEDDAGEYESDDVETTDDVSDDDVSVDVVDDGPGDAYDTGYDEEDER